LKPTLLARRKEVEKKLQRCRI